LRKKAKAHQRLILMFSNIHNDLASLPPDKQEVQPLAVRANGDAMRYEHFEQLIALARE
jgi:hypothetical protein